MSKQRTKDLPSPPSYRTKSTVLRLSAAFGLSFLCHFFLFHFLERPAERDAQTSQYQKGLQDPRQKAKAKANAKFTAHIKVTTSPTIKDKAERKKGKDKVDEKFLSQPKKIDDGSRPLEGFTLKTNTKRNDDDRHKSRKNDAAQLRAKNPKNNLSERMQPTPPKSTVGSDSPVETKQINVAENGIKAQNDQTPSLVVGERTIRTTAQLIPNSLQIEYTREAEENGAEGIYYVTVWVDTEGKVTDAKLTEKIGYGMDIAVLNATSKAQFLPKTNALGRPIPSKTSIEIELILK